MPLADRLAFTASALLALGLLVGLWTRRRADASIAFTTFVVTACLGHGLVALFPHRFWTWEFWFATDAVQAALYVAIAFEIAYKTFRPLPRGYRKARWLFGALTLATLAAVVLYPSQTGSAFALTFVVARVFYGAAFLFGVFFALTAYHYVPVDPVQRDVALGATLMGILAAFTALLSNLDPVMGWGRDLVVKVTYPLLLAWWAYRMWSQEEPSGLSRETMEHLQPWRVKRVRWDK